MDLPGRPLFGHIVAEHLIAEALSCSHQFLSAALVQDGADVAVGADGQFIYGILERAAAGPEDGLLLLHRLHGTDVIDGKADGSGCGGEVHGGLAVLDSADLGLHAPSVRAEDLHVLIACRQVDLDGSDVLVDRGNGIENQHRSTLGAGVKRLAYALDGRLEGVGELVVRQQQVVPGEGVGLLDAGTGEVIVELVPDEALVGVAYHV